MASKLLSKADPQGLFNTSSFATFKHSRTTFVGMTVEEVNAIVATATADGQSVTTEGWTITGGTVSSARIIVAVQNALTKLAK